MTRLIPRKDEFTFFTDDCIEFTGYKTKSSIYEGLTGLINKEIIERGRSDNFYFINPMVALNGDRITFAKNLC